MSGVPPQLAALHAQLQAAGLPIPDMSCLDEDDDDAFLDKINKLRDIPHSDRDGDLSSFLKAQNTLDDNVNIFLIGKSGRSLSTAEADMVCFIYILASDTKPYSSRLALLDPSIEPLTTLAAAGLSRGRFAPSRLTWELEPAAWAEVRAGTPLGISLVLRLGLGAGLADSAPGLAGCAHTGRPRFDNFMLLSGLVAAVRALPRPRMLHALRAFGYEGPPDVLLAAALDRMLERGAFALLDCGGPEVQAQLAAKLAAGCEELLRLRPHSPRAHLIVGDILWRCGAPAEAHAKLAAGAALAKDTTNQPFTQAMCLAYAPMLIAEGALGPTHTLAQLRASAARVAVPRRAAGWAFTSMKEALKDRTLAGEKLIAAHAALYDEDVAIPSLPPHPKWASATPAEVAAAAAQRQRTACATCGQDSAHLRRCSRCKGVQYCGRDCQVADWPAHKAACKAAAAPDQAAA